MDGTDPAVVTFLADQAKRFGAEPAAFKVCVTAAGTYSRVIVSRANGVSNGVTQVPTFFVNGKKFINKLDRGELDKAIVEAKKKPSS